MKWLEAVSQYESGTGSRGKMTPMVRMSIDQRRGAARQAARELLRGDITIDRLTLSMIAEHCGTPLATLTYAYGSIGQLLGDLRTEFETAAAADQLQVGAEGW